MAITTSGVTNPYSDLSASNAPSAVTAPANTNLAQTSATQNLAAAPTIDSLTQAIQDINQKAYMSAPGRTEALGTIQNELSGNLAPSTIYSNQLANAEKYGAGGFSSDSQAWNTAIARGLGIDTQNLITAGQGALNSFYAGMPTANAQTQMTTPALAQQQSATAGSQALEEQQIANQAAQANQSLAQKNAALYAATYGNIPGYNQYGIYTGQTTGTSPSAPAATFPTTGTGSTTPAAGGSGKPTSPTANGIQANGLPNFTGPFGWGSDPTSLAYQQQVELQQRLAAA